MFRWNLAVETETVHIPIWNGEKKLVRPRVVSTEPWDLRVSIDRGGERFEVTLSSEHPHWDVELLCTVDSRTLRVRGGSKRFPVFHSGKKKNISDGQWHTVRSAIPWAEPVADILASSLQIYQRPDTCHAFDLSVWKKIDHRSIPILGTDMKVEGRYLKIKEVALNEDEYRVTVRVHSLHALLGQDSEELDQDQWYQTLMELGEVSFKGWHVSAKKGNCGAWAIA